MGRQRRAQYRHREGKLNDALASLLAEIRLRLRTEDLEVVMQAFWFLRVVLWGMPVTAGHVA
jgi:hypothetical protein